MMCRAILDRSPSDEDGRDVILEEWRSGVVSSFAGHRIATMGTVSPDQARDFYRASASFYRQAPWRTVGEGETIKIRCQQLGGGPWYAVILGKMINIKGLMLFDDREGRRLMQRAEVRAHRRSPEHDRRAL